MDASPQHSSNTPNPSPIVQTTNTNNPNANARQDPRPNPVRGIPTRFPSVGHRAFSGSGSGSGGFDQPSKKRGRPRKYGPPYAAPQNTSGNAMLVLNQGSRVAGGGSRVRGDALAGVVRADSGGSRVRGDALAGVVRADGGAGGFGGGSGAASDALGGVVRADSGGSRVRGDALAGVVRADGGAGGFGGGSGAASDALGGVVRADSGGSRVRGDALAGVVRADGAAGGFGGGSGVASDALGGAAGIGFTLHMLMIKPGEDIFLELMAFLHGRRTLCILSATGCIGKARIKPSPSSEYTVYEGCYEILSLQGSFTLSEVDRTGYMKVIMSGPAGRMIAGDVSGMLVAASPVQVIVGSFHVPGPVMLNLSGPPSPEPSVGSSNENAGTPK